MLLHSGQQSYTEGGGAVRYRGFRLARRRREPADADVRTVLDRCPSGAQELRNFPRWCHRFVYAALFVLAGIAATSCGTSFVEEKPKAVTESAKFEPPDGSAYTGVSLNRPEDWSIDGAIQEWEDWTSLMNGEPTAISHEFTTLDNWPQWAYDIAEVRGATPMLSLETQGGYESEFSTTDIANGNQDNYIFRHAYFAREHRRPVFIRLGHEMNGEWYSYSAYNSDGSQRLNTAEDYRLMWKRVVIIFRGGYVREINARLAENDLSPLDAETDIPHWLGYPPLDRPDAYIPPVENVAFVWSPNALSIPGVSGNQPLDYYPGDEFVDWVAQDVYHAPWDTPDRKFFQHMEAFYQEFSVKRGKPYMLAELGLEAQDDGSSSDEGAMFLRRVLRWYEDHPKAKALVYWNWSMRERGKVFRTLDNAPEAANVLAHGWKQNHFVSNVK